MSAFLRVLSALLLIGVWAAGCTVNKAEPPAPAGPSEFSTSISLSASPDTLNQDGASQSQIGILVRDAYGQPLPGLGLRLDMSLNGITQDFGRLSAKSITTGSDGRAAVVYTAPAAIAGVSMETRVAIEVTPVGTNAVTQLSRRVEIRLVPPGIITPPGSAVPDFKITPDPPVVLQQVQFDASDKDLDGKLTSYQWTFGDGGSGGGRIVTHRYNAPGDYVVTLTVTDGSGTPSSRPKRVGVGEGERPKADFTISPTEPAPGQNVFFNASITMAGTGRHIAKYDWDFGNGQTATGVMTSHQYAAAGNYVVTLTATDNAGVKASVSKTLKVAAP